MTAYLVGIAQIQDPEGAKVYFQKVGPLVRRAGGRLALRTSIVECLQGDLPASGMTVVAFDSIDAARALYESDSYRRLAAEGASSMAMTTYLAEDPPGAAVSDPEDEVSS